MQLRKRRELAGRVEEEVQYSVQYTMHGVWRREVQYSVQYTMHGVEEGGAVQSTVHYA
jgi:hypothetical protein